MTTVHMVRHGPTHRHGLIGWTDVPADLSDEAALARLVKMLPQDAVLISSDLIRCVATADAIGEGKYRLVHDAGLREFNFGAWEEMTFAEVSARDPDISRAYWSDPGDTAPPGGESWNASARRISRAVDRLVQNHSGRDIIVVAHFGAILTQVQRTARMTPKAALSFRIDNLSVTTLEHLGSAWRILGVNHLP
ncbi:MAG: histidine phosphatase family protein [Rhodobacteraceae bacterium]|nr:histidine phosphatase family protein [Paracoccaceae bacterium]